MRQQVSRALVQCGAAAAALAGTIVAARYLATGSWAPRSPWGVGSFLVAELFLAPLGGLLVARGALWRLFGSRGSRGPTRDNDADSVRRTILLVVTVIVALLSALLFAGAPYFVSAPVNPVVLSLMLGLAASLFSGLALGLILQCREGHRAGFGGLVAAATVTGALLPPMIVALLVARTAFPSASRAFEWGRYGFRPAVQLRDLGPITHKLRMRFPPGTRVAGGEFIAGPGEHLFGKIEIPAASIRQFLNGQSFQWGFARKAADVTMNLRPEVLRGIAGKTQVVYAGANTPRDTDLLWVVLCSDKGNAVLTYLCWCRTDEEAVW